MVLVLQKHVWHLVIHGVATHDILNDGGRHVLGHQPAEPEPMTVDLGVIRLGTGPLRSSVGRLHLAGE